MIARLPYWVLTEKNPAFYDSDSKTTVEMTSKVYAKMQELIDDYNKFVDEINKHIEEYETSLNQDFEEFQNKINKIMHDYIHQIDEKIKVQDYIIDEAVKYMKANIKTTTQEVVNQLIQNGEITLEHTYDEANKKVSIIITNGGVNNE